MDKPLDLLFLTHADSDLITLAAARRMMENNWCYLSGYSLQSEQRFVELEQRMADADVIIVRLLGRISSIPQLRKLRESCAGRGTNLCVISATGELTPENFALSTVEPAVLLAVNEYCLAGGATNMQSLLCYLSDTLNGTNHGFPSPQHLPEFGIYWPGASASLTLDEWRLKTTEWQGAPVVGMIFYRAHWLSGNAHFVDALIKEILAHDLCPLPIFTSTLKDEEADIPKALNLFLDNERVIVDALINTTSFAMHRTGPGNKERSVLALLDVPIIQSVPSLMTHEQYQLSARGLGPTDTAMNVVLPEFDGRIISVPISFKCRVDEFGIEQVYYEPVADRVERVVGLCERFVRLRRLPNSEKRVAFVLTNASSKASQAGNAVGLDSPASLLSLLHRMREQGYHVGALPESSDELMHTLLDRSNYDPTLVSSAMFSEALDTVPGDLYKQWFAALPEAPREQVRNNWGEAPGKALVFKDKLLIAGLQFGNVIVALQPPRGFNVNTDAIYHQPDLPPTHHYYAFYRWLRDVFKADAIVHMGKHGTLEWLPGKGVGLSSGCFPDLLLADLPLFYPFIINDPGEGCQAKRRAHATIIDHMTPAMTSAGVYGILAELSRLIDEYSHAELLDPARTPLLREEICALIERAHLQADLEASGGCSPQDSLNDDAVFQRTLQQIDGYLCELGAAQIRDGLHIFGQVPPPDKFVDSIYALVRLPNLSAPGLDDAVERIAELRSASTEKGSAELCSASDLSKQILRLLHSHNFSHAQIAAAINSVLPEGTPTSAAYESLYQVLDYTCSEVVPNLLRCTEEVDNLLHALNGGYVPPGPSGAPSRGSAHILPTGRNFYSLDPLGLPSKSAFSIGEALANEVLNRFQSETGRYPYSLSISVWGTSAMRTHGDDIGQVLALYGVRPVWEEDNGRVKDLQVIPLSELGRPRIDVVLRVSGFFRDAFPNLMSLVDRAVSIVAELDEDPEQNYVRKNFLSAQNDLRHSGLTNDEAKEKSLFRVFGCKPGSYGAGVLQLIQEKNWADESDFATAYLNWGGYAYSQTHYGIDARQQFADRLATVEVALHNQDNREHDIFDSDDYFQFHGGMIATIKSLTGKAPKAYFGDTHASGQPKVRLLKEEVLRVFRSRVLNPKWINSIMQHGYKGGLELAVTVDYMFGYDATSEVMDDWMYDQLAQSYALDPDVQDFLRKSNPWALKDMTERLLEAAQRKLWQAPSKETLDELQKLHLESDALLERRNSNEIGSI